MKYAVKWMTGFLAILTVLLLAAGEAFAAPGNDYSYPDFQGGYVDMSRYVQNVRFTVGGVTYTESQAAGLVLETGTPITFRFDFCLQGRSYDNNDKTKFDPENSVKVVYTNGTTYLNNQTVAGGEQSHLDDSSLMKICSSGDNTVLRVSIDWLLEMTSKDFRFECDNGVLAAVQKDNYLYFYFPNGIGSNLYADPGYFTIRVIPDKTVENIRIPIDKPGYFVPEDKDAWTFETKIRQSDEYSVKGYISTHGDITVQKKWITDETPPTAEVLLHYTQGGSQHTASREFSGNSSAVFTIHSGMTDCWLEENMNRVPGYVAKLEISEDKTRYTYTNIKQQKILISKKAVDGSDELPGAHMELYRKKPDGTSEKVSEWISGAEPHEELCVPGSYEIKETLAPLGYAVATNIGFVLGEDYKITPTGSQCTVSGMTVTIKDAPLSVKLQKVDQDGNPLAGAKLQLKDVDTGEIVDEWTSGTEPHVIKLAGNKGITLNAFHAYQFVEVSPPANYSKAKAIEFRFNGDGTIPDHPYQLFSMVDKKLAISGINRPGSGNPGEDPGAPGNLGGPGSSGGSGAPGNPGGPGSSGGDSGTPNGGVTDPNGGGIIAQVLNFLPHTGGNMQTGDTPWPWVSLAVGILCIAAAVTLWYWPSANVRSRTRGRASQWI